MARYVIGVDPGPKASAIVCWDGEDVLEHQYLNNLDAVDYLCSADPEKAWLAIEMVSCYGMKVGAAVFETALWVGRLQQAWVTSLGREDRCTLVIRPDAKLALTGKRTGKDKDVRAALIDMYGGKGKKCPECKGKGYLTRERIPCTACYQTGWETEPGAFAEISSHKWAALAIAWFWWHKNKET